MVVCFLMFVLFVFEVSDRMQHHVDEVNIPLILHIDSAFFGSLCFTKVEKFANVAFREDPVS